MPIIASVTKDPNGDTGPVRTRRINAKARLVPAKNGTDKAPAVRVIAAGTGEPGAARTDTAKKTGREHRPAKRDAPNFPQPIAASLIEAEAEGSHHLIWSRGSPRRPAP